MDVRAETRSSAFPLCHTRASLGRLIHSGDGPSGIKAGVSPATLVSRETKASRPYRLHGRLSYGSNGDTFRNANDLSVTQRNTVSHYLCHHYLFLLAHLLTD